MTMGQSRPAFDILARNSGSTRLPAAMHSFCLRSLYAHNRLAIGELELAGAAAVAGRCEERHLIRRRGE
jgi:poly(3-hydroxyalkanoate) synthetase